MWLKSFHLINFLFKDLPSIVSGNTLIMLDPHERYFAAQNSKGGLKFQFDNQASQALFNTHPDQFKPYTEIKFGSDCNSINLQTEFKGTLFRFPIRNKAAAAVSALSKTHKPFQELINEDVISSFLLDFHLVLLFLRNLEKIEIWEKRDKEMKLIASTCINFEKSDSGLREKRRDYMQKLRQCVDPVTKTLNLNAFNKLDDLKLNLKMVIDTFMPETQSQTTINRSDEYLMSHFVKFKSCSDKLCELAEKTASMPLQAQR